MNTTPTPRTRACNVEIAPATFCTWPLAMGDCPAHPRAARLKAFAPAFTPRRPSQGLFIEDLDSAARMDALHAVHSSLPRDLTTLVTSSFENTLALYGISANTYWSEDSTPFALDPTTPCWLRFSGRTTAPSITSPGINAWDDAHRDAYQPSVVVPAYTDPFSVEFHVDIPVQGAPTVQFQIGWLGSAVAARAAKARADFSFGPALESFLAQLGTLVRYRVEQSRRLIASGQAELAYILAHRIVFAADGTPLNLPA